MKVGKLNNIGVLVSVLWLCIAISSSGTIITYWLLVFEFLKSVVEPNNSITAFTKWKTADAMISAVVFIAVPLILLYFRKFFFNPLRKLNATNIILTFLTLFYLFAPIISFTLPYSFTDTRVTKLLPPLASIDYIKKKSDLSRGVETIGPEEQVKVNKLLNLHTLNSFVHFDSLEVRDKIICYQDDQIVRIMKSDIIMKGELPEISTRVFLLGTDEFGRDLFSRIIYGSRVSLTIGIFSAVIAVLLGVSFGFVAGYFSGPADIILSRTTDLFLTFPAYFIIILASALFGSSILILIFIFGALGWPSLFKIVKGEVIAIKQKDFFVTSKMLGLSGLKLLTKEIMPLVKSPVLVNLMFMVGNFIIVEASLSYLGIGYSNSTPSWGRLILAGQEYMHEAWWLIAFPCAILVLTLIAVFSLGKLDKKFTD